MFLKKTRLMCLVSSFLLCICVSYQGLAEPTNLHTIKQQLIAYHDSGVYLSDITRVDAQAKEYIAKRIAENQQLSQPLQLAVVFDIDETALSGYQDMLKLRFGGTNQQFTEFLARADEPAIAPTLALYNYIKSNHLAAFFVTGRGELLRQATTKNLLAAGYHDWDGLYLRPEQYHEKSIVPYKSSVRKHIENAGYTIIATIGDQQSDLDGGYAEKGFKLPNPYYFIN